MDYMTVAASDTNKRQKSRKLREQTIGNEEHLERKRAKNRTAAAKFRDRKNKQFALLEMENTFLKEQNSWFKKKHERLSALLTELGVLHWLDAQEE